MMQDMREMMAEFKRNNGPSESGSAGGSAAVRGSPRRAQPTAAPQTFAAAAAAAATAAAGGGARGGTTAASETTLREDASRNCGVTGRRGAAVPVDVDPARGQPDQQRGAREWSTYPVGELGTIHDPSPS